MGIAVNGRDITDEAVQAELVHHAEADNPLKQSVHELVLRALLDDEARRLGIPGDSSEARIAALFAQEVKVPEVDESACQRYYAAQRARFSVGELAEVRHILFQVTPSVPLELLRETGQAVLDALQADPSQFETLARQYSNCPSGAVGGSLGQIGRGQTVPEFESLVFRLKEGELHGRLLETRFGLHIVQVQRRVDGMQLPYESVRERIAAELSEASWRRAIHQYLHLLAGQAQIDGIDLAAADSPLVQ
ncbi:peptidylprolyl isomerase [Massilia sp. TS11]|uniref:peptidylprolyl isomerase n=1 Tax=Massilia sp. TS11 TaxID=2908003 RepID=UPI001EDB4EF1|nr:peptidylprolyl isomerase [Massilia sp. TS11]MCG2585948.1 peptidyl-prolyl cis-trans isomerase [Massilia sp. TS11]